MTLAPLGLASSFGCGDRLGLATPGHLRAFQRVPGIAPIFAQQSARELARTGRTPAGVLADALAGAAGWQGPMGADADHVKTTADIDAYAAAGYTLYTFDPGELVLGDAYTTAGKFDPAIAHVAMLYAHLASKGIPFEVEVSFDETDTPTTPAEHIYIATQLHRQGVQFVSFAPHFLGGMEKGIEYTGDLVALRANIAAHAAIARALGPYKLSLHSGSDKFNVYAMFADETRGLFHVKTAGTSYLEALRVLRVWEPALYLAIVEVALAHYTADRRTYHVSAELAALDAPGWRQVLHVTFGSVMAALGSEIRAALAARQDEYTAGIEAHFVRHLEPLAGVRE